MTKKHFVAFARVAKGHVEAGNIAAAMAIYYAVLEVQDNAHFKRDTFMEACGLTRWMLSGKAN
jgi:hypothetical protein